MSNGRIGQRVTGEVERLALIGCDHAPSTLTRLARDFLALAVAD
jgi:hypothetical protein